MWHKRHWLLAGLVVKGTVPHADEASVWNDLHARYEVKRINHEEAFRSPVVALTKRSRIFHRTPLPLPVLMTFARRSRLAGDGAP